MFDVIVDYPDSLPALKDLKASLARTHHALSSLVVACPVLSCLVVSILVVSYRVWAGRFPQLVTSLRKTFEKRLLHAGANTADIITQYISTIKALHELDPSGTTLRAISKPVQQYLRGRRVFPASVSLAVCARECDAEALWRGELGADGWWRCALGGWGQARHGAVHRDRAHRRQQQRAVPGAAQAGRRRYLFLYDVSGHVKLCLAAPEL
eukprot:3939143-Rhodomonas_salina.4